jgi:hypothetical protein
MEKKSYHKTTRNSTMKKGKELGNLFFAHKPMNTRITHFDYEPRFAVAHETQACAFAPESLRHVRLFTFVQKDLVVNHLGSKIRYRNTNSTTRRMPASWRITEEGMA